MNPNIITEVEEYLFDASLGRGSYNQALKLLEELYNHYQFAVNSVCVEEENKQ